MEFRTFSSGGGPGGGAGGSGGSGGGGGGGGGGKGGSGSGGLWAAYLALLERKPVGGTKAPFAALQAALAPAGGTCWVCRSTGINGCNAAVHDDARISLSAAVPPGPASPPTSPRPAPHQVTTKAVTAALLNGLGDVVAQLLFEKGQSFDWKRLGIFSFLVGDVGRIAMAPQCGRMYCRGFSRRSSCPAEEQGP